MSYVILERTYYFNNSPELCDIMFHSLENKFISLSEKIFKWFRYRDDILMFWLGDEDELVNFISRINSIHPTLKFTYEWSKTEINFLDLTLYKEDRFQNMQVLDIKCFSKSCDTFQYLSRDSSHPNSCFHGMIKGEAIRYIRNSSSEAEYERKLDFFISKLLIRGYKKQEVLPCLADIPYKRRYVYLEDVPKNSSEIPLVFCTHYFPQRSNVKIKKAFLRNWHYISNNQNLCKIFPCPPILALRRTQNLGERLVRAKITSNSNQNISLSLTTPNIEETSSKVGICPMSPTLMNLIALLEET